MVGLPLLVGVALQHRWDPAAAAKTVAMVEQLMTDVGVKGPIKTREVTEYVQGDQRTGWHMLSVSADRDLYDVYVGEFGGPIQIIRGYEGYDNRDLKKNDLLPIDSPLIFNYADHILSQLSKRNELGDPSLSFAGDNAAVLRVPILRNGKTYTGPEGGTNTTAISFRPDLGVITSIWFSQDAVPVNAKDPANSLDAARSAAQRALQKEAAKRKDNPWYDVAEAKLTGTWTLVNYRGFAERVARLAWSLDYEIDYKPKERQARVAMSGGPVNVPTIGEIYIDSQNGSVLATTTRTSAWLVQTGVSPVKVGNYFFYDFTALPIQPPKEDAVLPNEKLELFRKVKAGG